MKRNTDCCCGIDFQRDYFSAVQYSLKERAITQFSIQTFPAGKQAEEWKVWRRELKSHKSCLMFSCSSIDSAIPAQYAIIKLATVDADEPSVEETLEWELRQYLIGDLDDFVLDAQEMVGIATGRTRTFLLTAYRRTLVQQTADLVRSVNFKPRAIMPDIFGLINVFEANYRERSATPCLLVHCEEAITKLVLSRGGEFLDFHCFNNTHEVNDETDFAAGVGAEIDRFCIDRRPDAIFVTGSWFRQVLRRESFFETVKSAELLNPFREIKYQVEIDEQQLKECSTQLAVAVGMTFQGVNAVAVLEPMAPKPEEIEASV